MISFTPKVLWPFKTWFKIQGKHYFLDYRSRQTGVLVFKDHEEDRHVEFKEELLVRYLHNRELTFLGTSPALEDRLHRAAEAAVTQSRATETTAEIWQRYVAAWRASDEIEKSDAILFPIIKEVFENTPNRPEKSAPHPRSVRRWIVLAFADGTYNLQNVRPDFRNRGDKNARLDPRVRRVVEEEVRRGILPPEDEKILRGTSIWSNVCDRLRKMGFRQEDWPSKQAVYRVINGLNQWEVTARAEGVAAANRRFPHLVGIMPSRPLEICQADSTELDIFVVDNSRTWTIGRPHLTIVVDAYASVVLGYSLSFGEDASAYLSAFLDAFVRRHPKAKTDFDLPFFGKPSTIIVDNGKPLTGNTLKKLSADLDIIFRFARRGRGEDKAVAERMFGEINSNLRELRGSPDAKWRFAKGKKSKPEELADMTIGELESYLDKFLADVVHPLYHSNGMSRYQRWCTGASEFGIVPFSNLQQLDVLLSEHGEGVLTENGVLMFGLHYSTDDERFRDFWCRKDGGNGRKVNVKYKKQNIDRIQVEDWLTHEYIEVQSTRPDLTRNMPKPIVELILEREREEKKEFERINVADMVRRRGELQEMAVNSRNKTAQRKKEIRMLKEMAEKDAEQGIRPHAPEPIAEKPTLSTPPSTKAANSKPPANDIKEALLARLKEKRTRR